MPAHIIRFSSVEVIDIAVTLSQNPACRSGPPIELSWIPECRTTIDLDFYELTRRRKRDRRDLLLSAEDRLEILQQEGFSSKQMNAATMEVQRVSLSRRVSAIAGSVARTKWEALAQRGRKNDLKTSDSYFPRLGMENCLSSLNRENAERNSLSAGCA